MDTAIGRCLPLIDPDPIMRMRVHFNGTAWQTLGEERQSELVVRMALDEFLGTKTIVTYVDDAYLGDIYEPAS